MKRWMLVVAMLGLLLVAGYARAATNVVSAASEDKTLISYYMSGGVLMHPMSLGLFGVVWLTLYHILVLRRSRLAPAADIAALRVLMYQRDAPGAHAYCEQHESFLAHAMGVGASKLNRDAADFNKTAAETAIIESVDQQETRMSFWLNLISVIAALSPMLGLLGTVQGMIGAFDTIGKGGMGKPELLAGNIGIALITTFYGLCIGIPAMLAFFLFRGIFNARLAQISVTLNELLELFTGEGVARQRYEYRAAAAAA
ncbi:MAG: MotA/TolQ/ExbB proton channel family protein, partial [bacterium]|nr:MotA/TolQ/ExbB proton channel family protein [bacterium]